MTNNISSNKKIENLSIGKFISEYEVCIPAIQREYVQGFKIEHNNEVREKFLKDIFNALDNNQNLNLNIIYGYFSDKKFYPVDGQQRLTTLFLIYWYLHVKNYSSESNDKNLRFSYEGRKSANEFFGQLTNPIRITEFKEMLNSDLDKNSLENQLSEKRWFRKEWLKNKTVAATINVLTELQVRINDDNCSVYLARFNENITFDFLGDENIESKKKSTDNYIKLNSRGKQLEEFENLKALLSSLEGMANKTENNTDTENTENAKNPKNNHKTNFCYEYDQTYIDFFYEYCNKEGGKQIEELEYITKKINSCSMIYILNIYNLLLLLNNEPQKTTFEEFYERLYSDINNFDKNFYIQFFTFLENTLHVLGKYYKKFEELEFNRFFSAVRNFENQNHIDSFVAKLFYFRYNHQIVKEDEAAEEDKIAEESLTKFVYVLDNLNYNNWSNRDCKKLKLIQHFCEKSENNINFIELFENLDYKKYDNFNVCNDIKVRIKELSIKARIMKEPKYELSVTEFKNIESRFSQSRIYFLLYISGCWEKIDEKNVSLLKKYIPIAKERIGNYNKTKSDYAIIVNTETDADTGSVKLCSWKEINKKCNFRDNGKNKHYWDNGFYYIIDKELEVAKNDKLEYMRIMYEQHDKLAEFEKNLNSDEYKDCWLSKALEVKNNKLFNETISYIHESEKMMIDIEWKNYKNMRINFFAYAYILSKYADLNNNSLRFNVYTRKVSETYYSASGITQLIYSKHYEPGDMEYENRFSGGELPVNLELYWEGQFEMYIPKASGYNRCFFYFSYVVKANSNSNAVFVVEKDKITLRIYDLSSYTEYETSFMDERIEIEGKIRKDIDNFKEICHQYHQEGKKFEEIEDFIDSEFRLENVYSTQRDRVYKYSSKQNKEISLGNFIQKL